MSMTRVRFRVREMMIAVALVGIVLGGEATRRRWAFFGVMAKEMGQKEGQCRAMANVMKLAGEKGLASEREEMKGKAEGGGNPADGEGVFAHAFEGDHEGFHVGDFTGYQELEGVLDAGVVGEAYKAFVDDLGARAWAVTLPRRSTSSSAVGASEQFEEDAAEAGVRLVDSRFAHKMFDVVDHDETPFRLGRLGSIEGLKANDVSGARCGVMDFLDFQGACVVGGYSSAALGVLSCMASWRLG